MAVLGGSIPWAKPQFFTDNGVICANYLVYVYNAGTSEQATTFTDKDLTTKNANPVVLDSSGRASIFLDRSVAYKFVLVNPSDTEDPQTSNLWTRDGILATPFYAIDNDVTRDDVAKPAWVQSDSTQIIDYPYNPVILYNQYADSSSGTGDITIPAGTLDPILGTIGDGLILEWEASYSSDTLSARSTAFGTNVDAGTGAASTNTRARYEIYRVTSASVQVSTLVIQDTGGGAVQVEMGQQTIGSLDLDNTAYTVDMKMDSGTFTVHGARAYFGKSFGDWTAL
jgi:hypothetical protein